ncbi:MAG: hypothetical protein J2P37_25810, partial [Ktedonobacteraceae bacterium]|nr:hypothetical protein [Ktedonobacteraceae bacterium]
MRSGSLQGIACGGERGKERGHPAPRKGTPLVPLGNAAILLSRPPTLLRSYELRSSGGLQGIYRG